MAGTKLYYFPLRGRGEFIRLIFTAAGQDFEDIAVPRDKWQSQFKQDAPFGQLPFIEYNGKKYAQSLAIARFFSRKFGLYGDSAEDGLLIDQAAYLADDMRSSLRTWFFENDPAKKAELAQKMKNETFPKFLGYFETLLKDSGDSGYFAGNVLSMADLVVYDILDTVLGIDGDAIAFFPNIQKLRSNVEAVPAIKNYLDSRTKTPI